MTSSNVPSPRLRNSRSPPLATRPLTETCVERGRERAALHDVNIEPAVAVVVEQPNARRSMASGIGRPRDVLFSKEKRSPAASASSVNWGRAPLIRAVCAAAFAGVADSSSANNSDGVG